MASSYEIPSWAGKPPTGLHLDVLKDDKLIQKLMVDDKRCYLFGRNVQMNDFCIDHASCSRVHAAFVYHKHLNIAYLVDLGSTHGTFIGSLRLESNKPTQLHVNSTFHFGASTRRYILRERPSGGQRTNIMEDLPLNEGTGDGTLLGLPESQTELDNLTEYNTAHNRRISMLGIGDENLRKSKSRKRANVCFNDEEIIINPEDIDPNVGRFRNLVQSTVVPSKRIRLEGSSLGLSGGGGGSLGGGHQIYQQQHLQDHLKMFVANNSNVNSSGNAASLPSSSSLYHGLPTAMQDHSSGSNQQHHHPGHGHDNTFNLNGGGSSALGSTMGFLLPNPAPDVTPLQDSEHGGGHSPPSSFASSTKLSMANNSDHFNNALNPAEGNLEPQKKKYAKEAWPGRKPMLGSL